ncbi:MAG: hypothetical protein ACRC6H_02970 [Culicoidibacterales bacterium]
MKKLMSATALAALVLTLTACGASETTGTAEAASFGDSGWKYVVEVTLKGDDVTEVSIDALPDPENEKTAAYAEANETKKSLKEDYGMKAASPIGKEWYEQAQAIEAFIVENDGASSITLTDGKIDNIAGATIKGQDIIDLYNEAVANAQ